MKAILFAGTHKTGTSTLQHVFSLMSGDLLKRSILYPEVVQNVTKTKGNHTPLINAISENTAAGKRMLKFIANGMRNSGTTNLILSAENLSNKDESQLNVIKHELLRIGIEEIKVVVYVRNYLDWVNSITATRIAGRLSHHKSLELILKDLFSNETKLSQRLQNLENVFSKLHNENYDQHIEDGTLLKSAFAHIGANFSLAAYEKLNLNTRASMLLCRFVNFLIQHESPKIVNMNVNSKYQNEINKLRNMLVFRDKFRLYREELYEFQQEIIDEGKFISSIQNISQNFSILNFEKFKKLEVVNDDIDHLLSFCGNKYQASKTKFVATHIEA